MHKLFGFGFFFFSSCLQRTYVWIKHSLLKLLVIFVLKFSGWYFFKTWNLDLRRARTTKMLISLKVYTTVLLVLVILLPPNSSLGFWLVSFI